MAPPTPALSGEVSSAGLLVRGWNWGASDGVTVETLLPGSESPLTAPQELKTDASGRFSTLLATTPQLRGALQAGANVQVRAFASSGAVSLPVGGKLLAGKVKVDGIITQLSGLTTPAQTLHLKGRDAQDYTVMIGGTRLLYSEGNNALAQALQPGVLISLEGQASAGVVLAETIKLLSVSRTGAGLSYEWSADGNTLMVRGTGWPGEHQVSLSSLAKDGRGTVLATAMSDSRGNLLLQLRPGSQASPPSWLAATSVDGVNTLAFIAIPLAGKDDPPDLFTVSGDGEQMGNIGSYCHQTRCTPALGVPLATDALVVMPGELLGLRSQSGTGTNVGITPLNFVADLYPLNEQAGQLATLDGIQYFEPASQPIFTTGEIPGRPFSIALPPALQSGKYALVLKVVWPGAGSDKLSVDYGFAVQVP